MQGYNKYYPPEYDGKSSLNALSGRNGLGKRAPKPGVVIVRFAMPFDMYCEGCDKLIAHGVRFNAEKSQNGSYYSIPIWKFSMECHNCSNSLVICTDPANASYSIISGGKLSAKEIQAAAEKQRLANQNDDDDPLAKLERKTAVTNARIAESNEISRIYSENNKKWVDTFGSSQKLRKIFREDKKRRKIKSDQVKKIQEKLSLNIPIVDSAISDDIAAKQISFGFQKSKNGVNRLVKDHLDAFGKEKMIKVDGKGKNVGKD